MSTKFEYSIESVVITSATGVEKEIKDLVTGVSFFESLYSPYIKCELAIVDAANLIETIPIIGQEKVKVVIKDLTINKTIKRDFYVSSIQNYVKGNVQASMYVLKLITPEYMLSGLSTVSQAFNGPISDIVTKIVKNELKSTTPNIEKSNGDYKVIIPNWGAYQAIDWLTKRATSSNGYPFAFYETVKDGITFESYETIFKKPVFNKYVHRSSSNAKDDAEQKGAMLNTALQYDIDNMSNTGKNIMRGSFCQVMHVVDHANRTYKPVTYDYLKDFKKKERLDKFPYITDQFKVENKPLNEHDAIHTLGIKNPLAFGANLNNYNNEIEFAKLEGEPFLSQIGLIKISLTVKGRMDLSVGKIIEFEVERNRPTSIGTSKNSNEYLSGKYIVQNIHHKMEQGKYYIIMEVAKESLGKKVK